jgi:outer membrane protein assembly factor BamD
VIWRIARGSILVIWITILFIGCSSAPKEEEILEELANLDKDTIFERAEALYSDKKYEDARRLFSFVYDTFPNDPLGHKAALRVADTYSVRGDSVSRTEARLRYRDFASRYPNDPDRDYALLMVGNTYTSKKLRPDRDLSNLHEALNAYRQLVTLYPNSRYAAEAGTRILDLSEVLAEHEWIVASFYMKNKRWRGAQWRLEYLKENYPEYSKIARVEEELVRIDSRIKEQEERFKKFMEERRQKAAERDKQKS